MATGNVIVTVIDVGQGQCTFVEIYNTSTTPKLVHALLFDCGSDKTSDETYTNLDYIATKVLTMDTPGFDCIFFSHSDKDHISLTRYVLDKIWETTKPVIGEVIYGGAYAKYTKNSFNILAYILKSKFCSASKVVAMNSNATNYDQSSKSYSDHLWRSSDNSVYVYGIVANVLSDDPDWDDNDLDVTGKTAEALNRVSMICGLYYAGSSYVICGDATHKTMGAVNNLFSGGTTVFDLNRMTTLPHHGSRATGFAVASSAKASTTAKLVVTTFSATLKSQILTISSFEKHKHPSLELMNCFLPTITTPFLRDPRLKETNAHRLEANIDITLAQPKGWSLLKTYYSFDTTSCMFGTRYSQSMTWFSYNLGASSVAQAKGVTGSSVINEFACWQFKTLSTGNLLLGGYASLTLPLVLFTAAATTAVAQKTGITALPNTDITETIISPVSVRIKERPQPALRPAQVQSQFHNQLNHFR